MVVILVEGKIRKNSQIDPGCWILDKNMFSDAGCRIPDAGSAKPVCLEFAGFQYIHNSSFFFS